MPERKPARGTETTAHVFPTSIPDFEMGMVPLAGIHSAPCRTVWVTSCAAPRLPQLLSRSLAAAQRSLRLPIILVKPGQSGQICAAPGGHNPAVEVNE